ncbi:MAG TPA: glycosyl hydrolase, partial [Blastocatellia bacterium]|nr:glycosyl hydrolase [Blastocatellia bacterium]
MRISPQAQRASFTLITVLSLTLLSYFFLSVIQPAKSSAQATNQTPANLNLAQLQQHFQTPPDDSRIMMRWWWFGPTISKEEVERELKVMKEGGIGGVEIQPVYPVVLDDKEKGHKTLPFLSNEFIELLRFTNDKARELGMRVDLTIGSGWPYGGPMVPISEAAGKLRVERVKLTEGQRRVPIPDIVAGEKLITAFLARTQGNTISTDGIREITEIKDGAVRLPADIQGANEIIFFVSSRTGQQVKRPAIDSEGYVLNHYDRAATENYLKNVGDRLLQAFGNKPPYAIFCDSLEVYLSDWTPDLLEEFQKRRGYDLKPYLPALISDFGPNTSSIRHDWGQTLTELLNERFLTPMHDWAKRNNTRFRIQGYGIPPMTVSGNNLADLPEGEGSQWKVVRASRWASSASHIYNKPVTSSETWTWLHSPSFRATPLDIKAEADLHFLQGINQLIGHGWPYTAPGVDYPGWRFYAAGVFNEKNPWWIVMPDLSAYLQRMSFLMRQGQPANDIA